MNQHTTVNAPENNHSNELLREFQSGVGSLNYLVQHSRPDLSNCVRELAKCMKSVGLKEMKLLLQAVNYLKNTKDYGLKFIKWNGVNEVDLNCYVDSDYAGDKFNEKKCIWMDSILFGISYNVEIKTTTNHCNFIYRG